MREPGNFMHANNDIYPLRISVGEGEPGDKGTVYLQWPQTQTPVATTTSWRSQEMSSSVLLLLSF